jgi:hypothetical protein
MLKIKSVIITSLVAIVGVLPGSAAAYFTTSQNAVALSKNVFLYAISYDFGTPKYDLTLPINALPNRLLSNDAFAVGYETIDSEGETARLGQTVGIVLSNAKVVNNQYFVPKGYAASFTLVVLVQATDAEVAAYDVEQNLALQVTRLPFLMTNENQEIVAGLNSSELQYYQTPSLDIR